MSKIKLSALFLSSAIILAGCADKAAYESNLGKSVENTSGAASEEITTEPFAFVENNGRELFFPELMSGAWKTPDRPFKGWCRVYDYDYAVRTTYDGEISDDKISAEIWELICTLPESGFEETHNGFANGSDYSITLKNSPGGGVFNISAGYVEKFVSDECGDLSVRSVPAFMVRYNDETVTYLVTNAIFSEFCDLVEKSVVKAENITEEYQLPDYSYDDITDSYPKDLIIFAECYSNAASGIQNRGTFIDIWGYVYEYDLDGRNIIAEAKERNGNDEPVAYDTAFVDVLYYEFYYKNPPIYKVDEDKIFECFEQMFLVDTDAGFSEDNVSCDAGQKTLYMIDIDNRENMLIKLRSKGDINRKPNDAAALELCEVYDGLEYTTIE